MYKENFIIDYLMKCQYFNEYNLNSDIENVLFEFIEKIRESLKKIDLNSNITISEIYQDNVFTKEDTTYFHESIQDDIMENYQDGLKIEYSNERFNVILNFYRMKNNKVTREKILKYVHQMLAWLTIIKEYEIDDCVKNLDVDIFLTKQKKTLPEIKDKVIGPKNVNTAYTYRCVHGSTSIKLYREEDLMKVFFHETFHTFNMDFLNTGKKEIQKLFNIDSSISIFESYCETWARIFHSLFLCVKYTSNNETTMKYFTTIMCLESLHSLLQSKKILKYMGLTFDDVINNTKRLNERFKEDSHVFSYYFVTAILMLNINDFIKFCINNNMNALKFNPKKLDEYVILIDDAKSMCTNKCIKYYNQNNYNKMIIEEPNLKMVLFEMF